MSKAFTRENDTDEEEELPDEHDLLPQRVKNLVTPKGLTLLQQELRHLMHEERPKIVEIVAWAASNGDRSENGDYLYGKKRLREIDRRVRYLTRRIESAEVVDPQRQQGLQQVFFGASVTYRRADGSEHRVRLVGVDEAEPESGRISWQSPVAQALMKSRAGDTVMLRTPAGREALEVMRIAYPLE